MSVSLSKIRALYVGGETTFGTAPGTLIHLRADEVDGQLEQTAIANEFARQGDYETAKIIGGRRGTVTTKHKLHGFLASLPTGAPTFPGDFGDANGFQALVGAIASALGAMHVGGYVTGVDYVNYLGVSDPNSLEVAAVDGLSTFKPGQAVVWPTGSPRRAYEMGWLTNINMGGDPNTGALLQRARKAPVDQQTLYGATTVFVRDLTPANEAMNIVGFTLQLVGHGADDVYVCTGCEPTNVKISVKVNEPAMIEITWGVGDWTMPGSGGGPAVLAWDFPEPEPVLDWQVTIGSGSTQKYPTCKELELDCGVTKVALEGGHSASGVEGWLATQRRPKLTLSMHFDAALVTTFQAQTALPISVQFGSQPGRMFGFVLPAARFGELPKRGDRDGATILDINAEGHYYAGDTGSDVTTPVNSPLRLAWA